MMGVVNECNESRDYCDQSLDESSDISMDSSMDSSYSAQKPSRYNSMKNNNAKNENQTVDLSSLNNNRRFSFGGANKSSRRRVSFGSNHSSSNDSAPKNLHSEVIRAKGAKITSQEERLKLLEKELIEMKNEKNDLNTKYLNEKKLCIQAKQVTEEHQHTIDTLTSTITDYESKVHILRDERNVATTTSKEIEMKFQKQKQDIVTYKIQLNQQENKTNNIQVELNETKVVIEQLQTINKENENTIQTLKSEKNDLNATIRLNSDESKLNNSSTYKNIQSTNKKMEQKLIDAKKQTDNLQEMMIQTDMNMDKVKTELQTTKKELQAAQEIITQHDATSKELLNTSNTKILEIDAMRKELKIKIESARKNATSTIHLVQQSLENDALKTLNALKAQVLELTTERNNLQNMMDELATNLDQKRHTVRELQTKLENYSKTEAINIQKAITKKEKEHEKIVVQNSNKHLQDIEELQLQIKTANTANNDMQKARIAMDKEVDLAVLNTTELHQTEMTNVQNKHKMETSSIVEELKELIEKKENLTTELKSVTLNYNEAQEQIKGLTSTVDALNNQNMQHQEEQQEKELKNEQNAEKNAKVAAKVLQKNKNAENNKIKKIEKELLQVVEERDSLLIKCSTLKEQHESVSSELKSTALELNTTTLKCKDMETTHLETTKEMKEIKKELKKKMKKQTESSEKEEKEKKKETEQAIQLAEKKCQTAEEKSERYLTSVKALEKKVESCKEETSSKALQLERMTDKCRSIETSFEKIEIQHEECKKEKLQYENRVMVLKKEQVVTVKKMTSLESQMKTVMETNQNMQDEQGAATDQSNAFNEMKDKMIHLENDLKEKEKSISGLESMVTRKTSTINKLEKQLNTSTTKCTVIETNIITATNSVKERDLKIDELQKECDEIFEDMEKKEQNIKNLNNEIVLLTKTITTTNVQVNEIKALNKQMTVQLKKANKTTNEATNSKATNSKATNSKAVQELTLKLEETEERNVWLEQHKLTDAHITKFGQLKGMNDKLKKKCIELHQKVEEFKELKKQSLKDNDNNNDDDAAAVMSSRDMKKYQEMKVRYKEIKSKLQEYYTKVKTCEKEQKKIINIIKKVPDINENTKNSTKCIGYVEKLIEFHLELTSISTEESKTIEMMETRVNALQEKRNEDLRLMEQGCSANERKVALLQKENDAITKEFNTISNACTTLEEKLTSANDTFRRTEKSDGQRIRFLEKENLDLMLQAKKLEKKIKTKTKTNKNATKTTAVPASSTKKKMSKSNKSIKVSKTTKTAKSSKKKQAEDKENSTAMVVEVEEMIGKKGNQNTSRTSNILTDSSEVETEDTMLFNELINDCTMDLEEDDEDGEQCQTQ